MFHLQAMREEKFVSFDEVLAFVSEEKRRITRISLKDLWNGGARFGEDKNLVGGNAIYSFNEYGFQALCSLIGISVQILRRLLKSELASDVLNDLLEAEIENGNKASLADIVVDEELGTIIGIVSRKYLGYSNDGFLRDILVSMDDKNDGALFPDTGKFRFHEAYSINSQLYVRLNSKTVSGVVKGIGGDGEDVSQIGVELSNTMAGGRAVRLSWFVLRLICENGLVSPVSGSKGRVIHTGTEASFRKRLHSSANGLISGLGKVKKMIENLGGIAFDPSRLAKHADLKSLYSIIPERDLKEEAFTFSDDCINNVYKYDNKQHQRDSEMIAALPFCIGGEEALNVFRSEYRDDASMYDFINIFTEHAKILPYRQKIQAETNAGELASWISRNKRKFI